MNRALLRISIACLAMFVLLLINVNYVQAFRSSYLASRPGNIRIFDQQFQYQRGSIFASGDGSSRPVRIADSQLIKGTANYQRHYPFGPVFAPVTGYDSIYSATGIEQAEDKELAGTDPRLAVHNLVSLFTGKTKGATVYLTISAKAQEAAYQALQAQVLKDNGLPAAAVAINPSTGAILALASYPSFNPNSYATLSGTQLRRVDRRYQRDKSQPLLNRALNETYPPGSSFKVVTSSAAFSSGTVKGPNSTVPAPTDLPLPGSHSVLINDDNGACGNGHPPIIEAFWLSCNTAFGDLGIKLKASVLHHQADLFGMNNANLTIPLAVSPSHYPLENDPAQRALSAIGQFDDTVTPLQEAMFAASIANGGQLMSPYMVQSVLAPDQAVIQSSHPSALSTPVSPQVASDLTQMMTQVTQNAAGTAFATANKSVAGVEIAGKTGTAQNGINNTGLNDAVFTCFAPVSNPKIAVGVIVQGGGFGADAAAPIAVKIIQAYLGVS
jgi:peptidoglycan glycosyltransferase